MKSRIRLFKICVVLLFGYLYSNAQLKNTSNYSLSRCNQTMLGENAYVFNPDMNMSDIQTLLDTLYSRQAGRRSEFSRNRYALFFLPGTYTLDVKVGYYMQVYGLGESPEDVVINGAVRSKSTRKEGHVLTNFWRSVENLTVIPTIDSANIWGVSQAAPLRRMNIKGNLQLHDGGYASGGFLVDSKVDGTVLAGQQQQWFTRNSSVGEWTGGAWNIMFMGVRNAPEVNWPAKPNIVISKTPTIREKPYIVSDKNGFSLKIPALKTNSVGYQWIDKNAKTIRLKEFYIANPSRDNSSTLNAALQKGKNILFTPGIYSIDKSLKVTKSGTVVYGIGLTTLQATNGNSVIEVDDVDGVTVSNLMLDAGFTPSETLFRVGQSVSDKSHATNPVFLYDIYVRVGGPFEGSVKSCVIINSNNVFVDNIWLWRADHGNGVGWFKNRSANGLIVNGKDVTIYGLFNEHFQEYQTIWNGENGKVYFYQSEMPYDPPTVEAWKNNDKGGYASYKVSDHVKKHEAWGVGVYCVFYDAPVVVDNAIETPDAIEQNIHRAFTVWLNGNKESIIKSIINGKGDSVNVANRKAVLN